MEVVLESQNSLEHKIKVTVPALEVGEVFAKRLSKLASTVKMSGFRPGKVPLKVVEQRYGKEVWGQVYDDLISKTYPQALDEQKLRPVGSPRVELVQAGKKGDDFVYTASFEVYPEFEPSFGEGALEKEVAEVLDADVERTLGIMQKQRATQDAIERPVVEGDIVQIHFTSYVEGEELPGGKRENYQVKIGEGRLLKEFEYALIGKSVGEHFTVQTTFPDDYPDEKLAGKEARHEVELHASFEERLPEVDEAFAKELGVDEGGVEGLRQQVREQLTVEAQKATQRKLRDQVGQRLLQHNQEVALPSQLLHSEGERLRTGYLSELARVRKDAELNVPPETEAMLAKRAHNNVLLGTLLSEIAARNSIEISQRDVRTYMDTLAERYENPKEVIKWYMSDDSRMEGIRSQVFEEKVLDWVAEHMGVEEKNVSFPELMGFQKDDEVSEQDA